MSCRFYQKVTVISPPATEAPGRYSPWAIISLDNPGSNACGMRIGSHAPCYFELRGETPNWKTCMIRQWLDEALTGSEY